MEVILLERIKNLGDLGDKVSVKPGFGRNYLLPKGKALAATGDNLKVFEERKAELMKKAEEAKGEARKRAEAIAGKSVTVKALASDEGKLYGSVGVGDIARAAEMIGLAIERAEIDLVDGPIHSLGSFDVVVRLHSDVETSLTVVVEEERAS